MSVDVFGLGNALVDALVVLDERDLLREHDLDRGTMHLVDDGRWHRVYAGVPEEQVAIHPGGSCANSVSTVARLGGAATFCGLVGTDDLADRYDRGLAETLGDHHLRRRPGAPTGKCLSLVSDDDAERTMVTDLGTAMELRPDELPLEAVAGADWLHITGYLFTGGAMGDAAMAALAHAKEVGTRISFDLGDTFVIDHFRPAVDRVIDEYADVVFMNLEEGRALAGADPEQCLDALGERADTVVLKLGKRGSLIKHAGGVVPIEARRVEAVDTTGAGDSYAGGFLYGLVRGWPLETCGALASAVAALTVSQMGGVVRDADALIALRDEIAP
jgi:sugar/nucleoside kinase (ribokinase family)